MGAASHSPRATLSHSRERTVRGTEILVFIDAEPIQYTAGSGGRIVEAVSEEDC